MFLVAVLLSLALLQNASGDEGPSFRSSWHDGGKPILRGGVDEDEAENDQSSWLDVLRAGISSLVERYGSNAAKPHIRKLVEETEKENNVFLHVEVDHNGKSRVDYKTLLRTPSGQSVWPPPQQPPPQWLVDFKAFIKNLIERYGRNNLDEHLRPVIKYVEKLNNVIIKDVDVDQFGDAHITYEEEKEFILSDYLKNNTHLIDQYVVVDKRK